MTRIALSIALVVSGLFLTGCPYPQTSPHLSPQHRQAEEVSVLASVAARHNFPDTMVMLSPQETLARIRVILQREGLKESNFFTPRPLHRRARMRPLNMYWESTRVLQAGFCENAMYSPWYLMVFVCPTMDGRVAVWVRKGYEGMNDFPPQSLYALPAFNKNWRAIVTRQLQQSIRGTANPYQPPSPEAPMSGPTYQP